MRTPYTGAIKYTRFSLHQSHHFCLQVKQKPKAHLFNVEIEPFCNMQWNAPVATSEDLIPPTSGSIWELNSAEVSRVNKWPWIKIALEICHGVGKETRRQGDSLQMAAPKPKFSFLSQYEANVQNRHRANCPFPKASKSGCQRIPHGSQKDLVCHSPLL